MSDAPVPEESMEAPRVLITPTSLCRAPDAAPLRRLRAAGVEPVLNPHGRPLSAAELVELLGSLAPSAASAASAAASFRGGGGVRGLVAGLDEITADVLDAAPALQVVARYGVGTDRVDLEAARRRGVRVTNAPGSNAQAVAELAVGLMFAVAREIPRLDAGVRTGGWPRGAGLELSGRTLGLVGFGAIGRRVAAAAAGLGMEVLAHDPGRSDDDVAADGAAPVGLDELCRRSGVVSLHVPLLESTRHLLDARRLALLGDDAIVINTARGGLLDEQAAREALDAGTLHGVGLDAYAVEPPTESVLVGHDRTVTTPHAGAHTAEAVERMGTMAVENLLAELAGRPGPDRVV